MRKTSVLLMGLMVAMGLVGWSAAPASAELSGSCEGSGAFSRGTEADGPITVDARAVGGETIVIPRRDTVQWSGSVTAPPGDYAGFVAVDLPPPFGEVGIDSWSGNSDTTENTGVKEYDLPAVVPAGVTFQVVGEHADASTRCEGFVNVELEGGPFKSPVTPVALAFTAAAAAGLVAAVWPLLRSGAR